MATQAKKLEVGAFVLTAVAVALAGLVWIGATRLFHRPVRMVTYFSESVQGLDPGGPIKYRGVPVGQVEEIEIAPDSALIEVVMRIDRDFVPIVAADDTLRAKLELEGLTGRKYLAIASHAGKDSLHEHPELDFEPPYPVIPSAPSTIRELATALEDVYEHLMDLDVGAISDDVRLTLQATRALLQDPRLSETLTNVEETSRTASLVATDLHRLTRDAEVAPVLDELQAASAEARALVADLRDDREKAGLQRAVHGWTQLAENGQGLMMELQLAVERLEVAVGEMETSTREIRDQPSLILFSEGREPTEPGRRR